VSVNQFNAPPVFLLAVASLSVLVAAVLAELMAVPSVVECSAVSSAAYLAFLNGAVISAWRSPNLIRRTVSALTPYFLPMAALEPSAK
jgi:hypothetical protein